MGVAEIPSETIGLNAAPRDYEFRAPLESSYSRTGEQFVNASGTQKIIFGDPDYYILVELSLTIHEGSLIVNGYARLNSPMLGILNETVNFSSWQDPFVSKIILTDVELSQSGCFQGASLVGSKIFWYVNDEEVFQGTIGNIAIPTYDCRLNQCFMQPAAAVLAPTGPPNCDGETDPYAVSVSAGFLTDSGGSGWRWAPAGTTTWNYEEIQLELHTPPASVPPPGCTCTCSATLPVIAIDAVYSAASEWSYGIELSASAEHSYSFTSLGTRSCPCPPHCAGGPVTLEVFSCDWDYTAKSAYGSFVPKTAGPLQHTYNDCAGCECVDFTSYSNTPTCVVEERTQTDTTCAVKRSVLRGASTHYYGVRVGGTPCLGEVGGPDCPQFDPNCIIEEDVDCTYSAFAEVFWPNGCCDNEAGSDPDVINDPVTGEHYFAYINGDNVYVGKSNGSVWVSLGLVVTQVTTSADCASPALTLGMNGVLYLNYNRSGVGVVQRFSTDQGLTWSGESTLFTNGKYPRICADSMGGLLFTCFKYTSGTSGIGKLYQIYLGPGDTAYPSELVIKDETNTDILVEDDRFDVHFSKDRHGRFALICHVSGETILAHYASSDYGTTFTRLN